MCTTGPHCRVALLTVVLGLMLSGALPPGGGAALAQPKQVGSPTPAAAAATAKDPAALALVKRMCDRLQGAKTFTVKGRASLELPMADGELATYFNDFDTAVRRPDGLAAHRTGDMSEFRFAYDGKAMTVFVPGIGRWGTMSAPATLDALLPAMAEEGGLNMPFDELLVADPYAAVTAGVTEAEQAGPAFIQGKQVEHLVLSSAQFRVEYWIDPGTALPVRSLVVYVDHPLRPHFVVEYAEWKLDAKLPDDAFALPKPQGVTEVKFRDAANLFR
jgi:hypothetical protein